MLCSALALGKIVNLVKLFFAISQHPFEGLYLCQIQLFIHSPIFYWEPTTWQAQFSVLKIQQLKKNHQRLCLDGVYSLETRVKSDWTKKVNNEEENSELK